MLTEGQKAERDPYWEAPLPNPRERVPNAVFFPSAFRAWRGECRILIGGALCCPKSTSPIIAFRQQSGFRDTLWA